MIYVRLLLLFLLFLNSFHIYYALETEEIVGGFSALQQEFPYHAAIVGKYNFSYHRYLLCSAGILNDYLVISAAKCFFYTYDTLKKLRFYAVVGVDVLTTKDIDLNEIENIYTYKFSNLTYSNNLAVTKLKNSLDLSIRPELAPLEIAPKHETFHGKMGVVAGFGVDAMDNLKNGRNREQLRISTHYGIFLKQINVLIIHDGPFRHSQGVDDNKICAGINSFFTEICGIMLPDETYKHRGVCLGDNGAPLVIGNKLVAIVTVHNLDCDDTIYGAVYTKVPKFTDFIEGLKLGRPIHGTECYYNNAYRAKRKIEDINTSKN